jgi:Rhomboid family
MHRPITPTPAHPAVRWLVWTLLGAGLAIALISQIFGPALGIFTPQNLLSLSIWGLTKGFIWQFATFLFVVPVNLSFYFAFYLLIELYLIWVIGGLLVDRVGKGPFLRLFFISGILAGGGAMALAAGLGGGAALAGGACAVYALLVAWTMFDPNMQLLLFMMIPIRAKYLVLGLLGLNLLLDLSGGAYVYATANVLGALIGYFYAVFGWDLRGPFPFTHRFDHWLGGVGHRIRRPFKK